MSELVVEIIIIGVVLIASVMVGGFTFGIFSFYLRPAEVTAGGATCSATANMTTCQLTLSNEGPTNTSTTGVCSMSAGTEMIGSVVGGGTVPAGGSLSDVECVAHGGNITTGSQVSGALALTNGAVAFFVGTLE